MSGGNEMSNYGAKVKEIMEIRFPGMHEIFARTLAEKFIEDTMYSDYPRYNADCTASADHVLYEIEQGSRNAVLGGVGSHDYF
jgi:hypothetical protein